MRRHDASGMGVLRAGADATRMAKGVASGVGASACERRGRARGTTG